MTRDRHGRSLAGQSGEYDIFDTIAADAGSAVAFGNAITDPNDKPGDASTTLAITAVNGSAANVDTFINTTYGQLFVDSSGFYEFVANAAFDALTPSDNPTETFNITVSNSLGQDYNTTLTLNPRRRRCADRHLGRRRRIVDGRCRANIGDQRRLRDRQPHRLDRDRLGHPRPVLRPRRPVRQLQCAARTARRGRHRDAHAERRDDRGHADLVTFTAFGDPESGHNELVASWNGVNLVDVVDNLAKNPVTDTFDVVGDGGSDPLKFTYSDDGNGIILDNVSVASQTSPPTESTNGHIAFTDVETGDTHTATVTPDDVGYVGTFTVDPVTECLRKRFDQLALHR